ncbi:MAG: hypothetical protein ABIS51_09650 [Sphingomonas sp.]
MTTIEEIQADYAAWEGRCVRVRGIAVNIELFADRQAMLEDIGGFGKSRRRSIIILARHPQPTHRRPILVEVTGAVGSCATDNAIVAAMAAAEPDSFIMVGGYCHTSLATYIRPISIRDLHGGNPVRLVEGEVPLDRRQLVEAPAGLPGRVEITVAARSLVAAIAARDEETFRRLSSPDVQRELDRSNSEMPDWLRRDLAESHRDFVKITGSNSPFASVSTLAGRQERVLIERSELADALEDSGGKPELTICWCKTADCSGRWPVIAFDADNLPRRPYLCVHTSEYELGTPDGMVIQARVDLMPDGFAEPAS